MLIPWEWMVAGGRAEAWVGEERICLRDAGELAACFAAQAGSLFGYACVLTRGERALADDLVQAAFEAAAREWAIAVATEPCSTNPVPKATEVLRVYSVATGKVLRSSGNTWWQGGFLMNRVAW